MMGNLAATIVFGISMVLVLIWMATTMFKGAKTRGERNMQMLQEEIEKEAQKEQAEPFEDEDV